MKRSLIKVDYEWAFNEVVSTHDFSGMSPGWIKSFVEGWCDGFVEGYILGSVESTIRLISSLKSEGWSSDGIKKITNVSTDVINLISPAEA